MGLDGLPHPLCLPERAGQARLGQQDRELLAAITRQQVGLADRAQEDVGELAEDRVPALMPMGVVDGLEVVQVEKDQRKIRPVALGPLVLLFQPLIEVTVVVELGQVVGVGERGQPLVVDRRLLVENLISGSE
jgi:hypothetical protein